jgi:hypothetical protein
MRKWGLWITESPRYLELPLLSTKMLNKYATVEGAKREWQVSRNFSFFVFFCKG